MGCTIDGSSSSVCRNRRKEPIWNDALIRSRECPADAEAKSCELPGGCAGPMQYAASAVHAMRCSRSGLFRFTLKGAGSERYYEP